MSKSYFPGDRRGRIDWYKNFADQFPKIGQQLDFTETEIANAVDDAKYAAYLLNAFGAEIDGDPGHPANSVLSGQSSGDFVELSAKSGAPKSVRPGIDTRRQARVERIKKHNGFNDSIAKQLKIASPNLDQKNYKAELGRARQTGTGVTIPFRKAGGEVDGINLYRQRKSDAPELVGFFMRTPAMDTAPGKSGEISYTARAVVNKKEVGQPSDAVKAVVR